MRLGKGGLICGDAYVGGGGLEVEKYGIVKRIQHLACQHGKFLWGTWKAHMC